MTQPTAHSHCLRKRGSLIQVSLRTSLQLWLIGPFCDLVWFSNLAENRTSEDKQIVICQVGLLSKISKGCDRHHSWWKGEDRKSKATPLGSSELWPELKSPVHQTAFSRCIFTILQKSSRWKFYLHLLLSRLLPSFPCITNPSLPKNRMQ